jgi:septal ring factor EnvC (AmiA/AmiB activator)
MIKDKSVESALDLISHEFASMESYTTALENVIDTLEIQLDQQYQENKELKAEIASIKDELADTQNALAEAHLTSN